MQKRKTFDCSGILTLLFLLLFLNVLGGALKSPSTGVFPSVESVWVEASGDVKNPGVYGFESPPDVFALIHHAGGLCGNGSWELPSEPLFLTSGRKAEIACEKRRITVTESDMSSFYRFTLGVPISINTTSGPGLTAVPGIGPKRAEAIISVRKRKGGFRALTELMSIHGINRALYHKISPYLTL